MTPHDHNKRLLGDVEQVVSKSLSCLCDDKHGQMPNKHMQQHHVHENQHYVDLFEYHNVMPVKKFKTSNIIMKYFIKFLQLQKS